MFDNLRGTLLILSKKMFYLYFQARYIPEENILIKQQEKTIRRMKSIIEQRMDSHHVQMYQQ